MTEVFKTFNKINSKFLRDIFKQKSTTYNLTCGNVLRKPETKTKKYGVWTARFNGKC